MRTRATALGALGLGLMLSPGLASASAAASGPATGAPAVPHFALRAEGIPDSLLRVVCGDAALGRLLARHDAAALAERLREALAGAGRYDATVRLTLEDGRGTQPGVATLSLHSTRPGEAAAPGATTPAVTGSAPTPAVTTAVAIVASSNGSPLALADPAGSFARGSRGGADPASIAAGIEAIRDDEVAAGRYAVAVAIDSVVTAGREARVYLRVAEGPTVTLESLEIPGATATKPSTAASIAGLKRGKALNPSILQDARERLVASNLFVSVGDPRVAIGSDPARGRVVIPVEEASASSFQGALGIGSGGLTGLLDVSLGNIGGSGRSAGARWAGLGDGNSSYALHYREPALFGRPLDATFQLAAQVSESLYTQTRWALGFGARPVPQVRGSVVLAQTGSVYSGVGRGSSSTWSASGRLEWQGLAPRANPTHGWGASIELESGKRTDTYPGYAQSTRTLLREGGSVQAAAGLGGRRVLYGGIRAEQVSFGDGPFPAEELLYLGGSNGLRGHRDRAYAGNRVLAMSVEQRWLTSPNGGRAYVFLDAARHELDQPIEAGVPTGAAPSATLARSVLSDGWEMGYGAGLLTRMASGIVGLELGLRPAAALREATIHMRYSSTW
jgi:hypothetical protein